jgi:cytochrome P450
VTPVAQGHRAPVSRLGPDVGRVLMVSLPSPVARWVGRRVMGRGMSSISDLSRVPFVPRSFVLPFQRDGLDPVGKVGRRRAGAAPVSKLTRLFGMNIWLVTGYEEARWVLADVGQAFSNDIRPLVASAGSTEEHSVGGLGFTDPPDHTRLRDVLTPEFTKRRLARLQPRIEQIVAQQLDEVAAAGPTPDLVSTFAFPVPFLVICDLLGLSPEDRDQFRPLGTARFDLREGGVGLFGAASRSREFLFKAVRQQRLDPGDGLIGQIIRERGDDISDTDLAGLADGVFLGGYETSASMLALGTLVLLQHPEAGEMVRQDPSSVDQVVEELLRYLTVVQTSFPRFARQDMDLFGNRVEAGDVVLVSLVRADRDSALATPPDSFDASRPACPHLAFGHGRHRCVGSELARMELRTAYSALLQRFPDMQLAVEPQQLSFRKLSAVYGVDAMPVRLGTPGGQ